MLTADLTPGIGAFYLNLARHSGTALICDAEVLSYAELELRVQKVEKELKQKGFTPDGRPTLLALPFSSKIESVVCYLAALRQKMPVLLLDPALRTATKQRIYQQLGVGFEYKDQQLRQLQKDWYALDCQKGENKHENTVAVMLSTSGSSGSPKAVMLSAANLCANTQSIIQYLPMQSSDVAITTLPLHYSFGLSVLNTHLSVGATVVLTQEPLISREFWQLVEKYKVTTLSGVPFHYKMLQKLRLEKMELPSIRYLAQAGGKLSPKTVEHFAQLVAEKGWAFFVMYGQTEATARMAYVPSELILNHSDVIGQAIPGGRFEIRDLKTQAVIETALQEGELYYFGDNVMLGYAQTQEDWSRPPAPTSTLATGDLACWTEEGLVKITGRLSRLIKIRGKRLQLDHLEQRLNSQGVEVYCCGIDDRLFFAFITESPASTEKTIEQIKLLAVNEMNLHPSLWHAHPMKNLPYLRSGKVDYSALLALCLKAKD